MTAEKRFEQVTRKRMRFPHHKGNLTVEQLWDLDLEDLNEIYKTLKSRLKKASEDSLLETSNPEDEDINIQIDTVKYIFEVKKEEIDNQLKEKERADKRQEIMAIIAAKDTEEMKSKSKEELLAMLRDL